jgi:hypothetical protein
VSNKQEKNSKKQASPSKNNGQPTVLYSVRIDFLSNNTTSISFPQNVHAGILSTELYKYHCMFERHITLAEVQKMQDQVKIVKPNQIPPGLKLHS